MLLPLHLNLYVKPVYGGFVPPKKDTFKKKDNSIYKEVERLVLKLNEVKKVTELKEPLLEKRLEKLEKQANKVILNELPIEPIILDLSRLDKAIDQYIEKVQEEEDILILLWF